MIGKHGCLGLAVNWVFVGNLCNLDEKWFIAWIIELGFYDSDIQFDVLSSI